MPEVAALLHAAGVPRALDRVDEVEALLRLRLEADVVEDVELGLGGEERGVRDAGRLQVRLGLGGDLARVAAVRLVGVRVDDGEVDVQRLLRPERVDVRGRHVRDELHVGLVDRLEPADRRAVEHLAVGEEVRVEGLGRHVEVLHDARQVAETDVDELDVLVPDEGQDFLGVAEHPLLLGWVVPGSGAAREARRAGVSLPCTGCFRRVTSDRSPAVGGDPARAPWLGYRAWQRARTWGRGMGGGPSGAGPSDGRGTGWACPPRVRARCARLGRRVVALAVDWLLCLRRSRPRSSAPTRSPRSASSPRRTCCSWAPPGTRSGTGCWACACARTCRRRSPRRAGGHRRAPCRVACRPARRCCRDRCARGAHGAALPRHPGRRVGRPGPVAARPRRGHGARPALTPDGESPAGEPRVSGPRMPLRSGRARIGSTPLGTAAGRRRAR